MIEGRLGTTLSIRAKTTKRPDRMETLENHPPRTPGSELQNLFGLPGELQYFYTESTVVSKQFSFPSRDCRYFPCLEVSLCNKETEGGIVKALKDPTYWQDSPRISEPK